MKNFYKGPCNILFNSFFKLYNERYNQRPKIKKKRGRRRRQWNKYDVAVEPLLAINADTTTMTLDLYVKCTPHINTDQSVIFASSRFKSIGGFFSSEHRSGWCDVNVGGSTVMSAMGATKGFVKSQRNLKSRNTIRIQEAMVSQLVRATMVTVMVGGGYGVKVI